MRRGDSVESESRCVGDRSEGASPRTVAARVGSLATLLATAGVCAFILVLPFGRPLQPFFAWPLVALVAAAVLCARVAGFRFHGLIPLGLFGLASFAAVWLSPFREIAASRIGTGALLMLLHPAAQIVGASPMARVALGACAAVAVTLTGLDILAQRVAGASLLSGTPRPAGQWRLSGSLPNPNEAAFVAVLAPLALAVWIGVWRNTPTRAARMAVVLAMACLAFGVVATTLLTGGRAIFGGLLLAALVPLVAIRPRWAFGLACAAAVAVALAWFADLGAVRARIDDTIRLGDEPRLRTWSIALSAFLDHPWLGNGPCVFFEINEASRPLAATRGWETPVGGMPWAHSIPIELLCERGILGLVAAIGVVASAARGIARAWREGIGRPWTLGTAAGLASLLAMSLVDLSFLKDWCSVVIWITLGCAVGAAGAVVGDRPASPQAG